MEEEQTYVHDVWGRTSPTASRFDGVVSQGVVFVF